VIEGSDTAKMEGRSISKRLPLQAILIFLLTALFLLSYFESSNSYVSAENPAETVIIAKFDVPVDPGSTTFMQRVVDQAISQHASAILVEMNTPGGLLSDMLSIINLINTANQTGLPTYTFVPPSSIAASAGIYIAMASNRIIMGTGAVIGPSTPTAVGGSPEEQNHTEAAMLKLMVSLAQKWGRNSTAAYSMVYGDQAYTTNEAVKDNLVDGTADSLNNTLNKLGLAGKPQITLEENLYEQFLSVLSNPFLDGILILLGVVAIVADITHPTTVLTVVGAISIIAGLIGAEAINASLLGFIILAISAALIFLELKLGHGIAVTAGIILGATGIFYLSQGLTYAPSPITAITELALFGVVISAILIGLYFRWIIGPIRRHSKLTGPESLVGQTGIAITNLQPDGEVRVAGVIWHAESTAESIAKGEKVKVKSVRNLKLEVEKTS
jgi:membrane-bound serine protease (ClpP class)